MVSDSLLFLIFAQNLTTINMKHLFSLLFAVIALQLNAETVKFGRGRLTVTPLAHNAVRVQYTEGDVKNDLPEWIYVNGPEKATANGTTASGQGAAVRYQIDTRRQTLTISNSQGRPLFTARTHTLHNGVATLTFDSPRGESLFGLGQFQDGYSNVRGLSRRLTQVNTQISLPMVLSSGGYGVLWNNSGMTEFNPCSQSIALNRKAEAGRQEVVNVTTTEGGRQEVRQRHVYEATVDISADGDYALLLDVGQKMARRHNLAIDGKAVIEMQNLWLPPTASAIVHLTKGRHQLTAELTKDDRPVLYYNKVNDQTTFRSPVATAVDYTVFVGTPDEVIATYRELTGPAPLMPSWALGYIHCRERFHSSQEILQTANRFRQERLPVSVMVQDWQYWGKYGWNSMQFDEQYYPDPKALTDSLHKMGIRLMLSVWSKIDKRSEVGRQMVAGNYYIPGTDWIDFFNPEAAAAYWRNFSERLVPLGIDAWWQDATEPENDDLVGRRVNNGRWAGEQVRNVDPQLVNKTVYEGLKACNQQMTGKSPQQSNQTPLPSGGAGGGFILTRCGFPGIQRYGSALWSGDVGNDWETFRRQIVAGLGVQAAGVPWWTYDAGGFFRPGDQYTNQDYIERMLRWIETSVYLPLMRVHGYMSNTEPWNYGPEAQRVIARCLREREALRPYLERCAQRIASEGYTLMRPLVFDFSDDPQALQQKYEYMFGPSLLVSPVTEPGVTEWATYLPKNKGGWTDYRTGQHYDGGQTVTTRVDKTAIPVFVRVGYEEPGLPMAVQMRRETPISNPMLWADVPDPDVIRVGDTYYMVSTTMHLMPGAPIMRSRDMKNWQTVGYVYDRLTDSPKYDLAFRLPLDKGPYDGVGTVYGRGQWATSLKYHNGKFYALLAPNEGGDMGRTYIYSADRAEGPWTLVSRLRHFHDCSLFFDDQPAEAGGASRVYVVYGTGEMMELKADLSDVVEGSHRQLFQREPDETGILEGSRMIKHRGKYYLLMISQVWAPGRHRREVCYRADRIEGPYEKRVILESDFGGFPHVGQGTIVDTEDGDWLAVIFQDRGGVGRVPTLSPVRWIDGWPMIGDENGRVPDVMRPLKSGEPAAAIVCSDDFGDTPEEAAIGGSASTPGKLGLHWQWNHNPVNSAWSLTARPGWLRLTTSRVVPNLYLAPNTLTQRMEGPTCSGIVSFDLSHMKDGDCAGFCAFNGDSGVLTVKKRGSRLTLEMSEQSVALTDREKAVTKVDERVVQSITLNARQQKLWLRIDADFQPGHGDKATFYYSLDGDHWTATGTEGYRMVFDYRRFFMGSKFAIFNYATRQSGGYVDVDYFHYSRR